MSLVNLSCFLNESSVILVLKFILVLEIGYASRSLGSMNVRAVAVGIVKEDDLYWIAHFAK